MALIDTSMLMSDPDFCDIVGLVRRHASVDDKGRTVLVAINPPVNVLMSVQGPTAKDFVRNPDLVNLVGLIAVWYNGELLPVSNAEYSDIIVWKGQRYQVHKVDEDYTNFGAGGHTKAFCVLENSNG